MKKKQIIGLGTLLLVLLLGSFTTSYAFEYTLSHEDIDKIVNRYWSGSKATLYKNAFYSSYDNYSQQYDSCAIATQTYNDGNISIVYFNASDVSAIQYPGNVNYMNLTIDGQFVYNSLIWVSGGRWGTDHINNNAYTYINQGWTLGSGSQLRTQWLFISNTILNFDGPWESSELLGPFVEPYTPIYFDLNEYDSTQYVDLTFTGDDGLTYNFSDIPLFYQPNYSSYVSIGYLNNPELETLLEDRYSIIYYDNNKWNARTLDLRSLDLYASSSNFLSVQTDDLITYSYTQKPNYIVKDCFYFYAIDDSQNNRAIALWYIASPDTVISGDRIDPTTFDNNDNYKNDVNDLFDKLDNIDNIIAGTEPVVDTLTNDDDVSGELALFISGDADDLASKFGYSPIENPFTTVVLDIVQQLTDVLLGSGDATIDLSNHGISWVIHSNDIYLPPGQITTFIHLMCNAWFIWGIYKYGFKLYEWIQSGRLQNLVNETNRHQYFLF